MRTAIGVTPSARASKLRDHDPVGNGRAINEFVYLKTDKYVNENDEENEAAHDSMKGRTHIILVTGKCSILRKVLHFLNLGITPSFTYSNKSFFLFH